MLIYRQAGDEASGQFKTPCQAVNPGRKAKIMTYTVKNLYGTSGSTNHRKVEAALRAARTREGSGWIVVDQEGNQWADNAGVPYIVQ